MRRSVWIFLAAILLPSLALAWLAVRSARDQQVVLEHQQAIIDQNLTDTLARQVQQELENTRSEFVAKTQELLRAGPQSLAPNFNRRIRATWPLAEVGFAVDTRGVIYSPMPQEGAQARTFRAENDRFLTNRETVVVFPLSKLAQTEEKSAPIQNASNTSLLPGLTSNANTQQNAIRPPMAQNQSQNQIGINPSISIQQALAQNNAQQQTQRIVTPQKETSMQSIFSGAVPEESGFRHIVESGGTQAGGSLARFLQDNLRLLVWYRPQSPGANTQIFGAQLLQSGVIERLRPLLSTTIGPPASSLSQSPEYCLALLDDRGRPVAQSRPGFQTDWKHPFVATEIGEALPHWEAALYLTDPKQLTRTASTLQLTLALIVAFLTGAILLGGMMMSSEMRRQMKLARQKTDFVSNVSHELKTPLTSIRMFADMLAEGRVTEPERRSTYLRIISAESARLTRLINNVLDFARMERGAPPADPRPCDLVEIAKEVVETCRPHLEGLGIKVELAIETETLPIQADRDSMAQIILNLISNAEKYGGKEIRIEAGRAENKNPAQPTATVTVLDRGPGIPANQVKEIFKPFHRLDDSLSSGISGSGLGLTLARRMARGHHGEITYTPRPGGGASFTLTMPLRPEAQA